MIVCPNCGGNLKFDIPSQKMHCAYCDVFIEPTEVVEKDKDADQGKTYMDAGNGDYMEVTIYTCPQCAAELMSSDTEATSFCSFCGAANILTERVAKAKRPQNIIPFKITKDECKNIYSHKLSKALFAPKALKDASHISSFRGIYMPYWSYNVVQKGDITLDGTTEKREGDYRVIRHHDLTTTVDNRYEGISHDASINFDDYISESLAPYNTHEIVDFRTAYLSGFYADVADVDSSEYITEAKKMAAEDVVSRMSAEPEFKKYSIQSGGTDDNDIITKTNSEVPEVERSMFPVWFLSHRDDENRVSYAAINGQTGKITADIPIDKVKYLIFSGVLAVVIWLILNMFNTSSLQNILRDGVIGGVLGLMINAFVLYKCADKRDENGSNLIIFLAIVGVAVTILGFWMKLRIIAVAVSGVMLFLMTRKTKKMSEGKNSRLISAYLLGIAISISTIIWNADPAADAWYYIPQVVIAVLVVWSFFDVLYYYNRLMTRPLPQFQRSGGDDNA